LPPARSLSGVQHKESIQGKVLKAASSSCLASLIDCPFSNLRCWPQSLLSIPSFNQQIEANPMMTIVQILSTHFDIDWFRA